MRRYNQRLYRAIRGYLPDGADVQDAMQETYVKAFKNLDRYNGDAAFSTWLIRIGINEALQHLRRTKRRTAHMVLDTDQELTHELPDTHMDPEHTVEDAETRRIVERAVDQLPEAYRAVYLLREVEGLDVAEVAEALAISESNVKVRAHRAKAMLKDALLAMQPHRDAYIFGNAHCDALVAAVMARI